MIELVEEVLTLDDELLEEDVTLEMIDKILDLEDELLVDVMIKLLDDDAGGVGVLLLTVPVGGIPVAGGVQLLPGHTIP